MRTAASSVLSVLTILHALVPGASGLVFAPLAAHTPIRPSSSPMSVSMLWGGGGGGNARDRDFEKRQEKLQARQAKAATAPKGEVEVTFPQKGNKVVKAKQGEPLGAVCKRAGVRVKFDCKNGRCATCQVRLNGRAAAKICQGAKVPGGATRKLTITLDNP